MKILIEPIESAEQGRAAAHIRHEVFGREWNCNVANPASEARRAALHLLARIHPGNDPVATLSVLDTTEDSALHSRFRLPFDKQANVARYTQLAVLKRYRGLNIPLALIVEARARFVCPNRYDYTWLLFDAVRAGSSSLCKWLGFEPSAHTFDTEYGEMRVMIRPETRAYSLKAAHQPAQSIVSC